MGRGLLSVCQHCGIETIDQAQKEQARKRIIQGGPFTEKEQEDILKYCESDVMETAELAKVLLQDYSALEYSRALFRGQYMVASALMEWRGVPIDTDSLNRLKGNWDKIKLCLIEQVDQKYGFYEGTTFKTARFQEYAIDRGIPWPTTPTGKPKLDDDTFKDICKTYPDLQDLRDLRYIVGQLRLTDLAVGSDGRNRQLLSAFKTVTGRNAPSNSKFIFGPAVWFRSLIKPAEGRALAYIDYSQQEFGIAATLSGDKNMQEAYSAGDPYLHFAKMAGAVPESATKATHGEVRAAYKACILGVQYGMKHKSLAAQAGISEDQAKMLLKSHRRIFPQYWKFVEDSQNEAVLKRHLSTLLGWKWCTASTRETTIQNWPIQATGADILHAACIKLMEADIEIIAPVHDAVLIEADIDKIEAEALRAQKIMEDLTEDILGAGHRIETDIEYIAYPDRYQDERGGETWDRIMRILEEVENEPEPQQTISAYTSDSAATS